jgi:hypothetical protein
MTKPTDAAIARAFWSELERQIELGVHAEDNFGVFIRRVQEGARKQNAEFAPVASAAESKTAAPTHVRCPKCTGAILIGKHCNGPECPLRNQK